MLLPVTSAERNFPGGCFLSKFNIVHSYKEEFSAFIMQLQDDLCLALEQEDGKATFKEDLWERSGGGGGRTRVITNGNVFENGGVNTSSVHGILPPSMMEYLNTEHNHFFACGLSMVLHPRNPFVPTVHANFRYFELYDDEGNLARRWFGGGADLTPYYLFDEDIIHFHKTLKDSVQSYGDNLYHEFKIACDQYFFNHHRQEARGVGGLFFDRLGCHEEGNISRWHKLTVSVGKSFVKSYLPIVSHRKSMSYTEEQKRWQEIRRGRYVEFNLIHDKGTLFGLKTNGRTESILISLPATVRWEYNYEPENGSPEASMLEVIRNPKDWI